MRVSLREGVGVAIFARYERCRERLRALSQRERLNIRLQNENEIIRAETNALTTNRDRVQRELRRQVRLSQSLKQQVKQLTASGSNTLGVNVPAANKENRRMRAV